MADENGRMFDAYLDDLVLGTLGTTADDLVGTGALLKGESVCCFN